ncbi:[protein-PII] uridylyltransferase [Flindersiella endophytica]
MTAREERTEAADLRLRALLADALKHDDQPSTGLAVVAVGGYGRGELSAASDLDVLLVHDERRTDVAGIAERIWYPLWDEGVRLDHSVRTVAETREAASADLRTALSLLDARHVAGDPAVTIGLRTTVLADWRRAATHRLGELQTSCRSRADRAGELASLLEPDLKESKGGLRDGVVLRALAATWLVEVQHTLLERVRGELLDVRDALHQVTGGAARRTSDRLLAELQPEVASLLGMPDREALLRRVYQAGRTLAHLCDTTWRRIDRLLADRGGRRTAVRRTGPRPGPILTPLGGGVAVSEGEVVLSTDARLGQDALLPLRAGFEAAERHLLLSPYACDRLSRSYVPLRTPWPEEARRLWTGLLGAGRDLVPVWETLDQAGLIEPLLPEWAAVRWKPQWSQAHLHTVDRHLLQTCVEASALVRRVSRPDLLVAAALLHDIGKGQPGDHSTAGAALARRIAPRWGFSERDTAVLVGLVRHHLLLIESATRRDLDDPATVKRVAMAVGDADTLDLLAALTEADARATGPVAWTPWRAGLLTRLVELVRARLERGEVPAPAPLEPWQSELASGREIEVVVEPSPDGASDTSRVTFVAPDQVGLLATVAGVLATARLSVRSASVETLDTAGVSVWSVGGDQPDPALLRERLISALAGGIDLAGRLSAADQAYEEDPDVAPANVRVVPGVSATATVLEVRAHDRPGLFWRICAALAGTGCSVRSAHVSTWANEAVDVFYLTTPDGSPLPEPDAEAARAATEAALAVYI